ncbi:MAG: hypothetical protein Q7R82_00470 [Candidatus Daviesbacteria bacterium]|nr:hypothetical protein [Candidatus Daviesbacteria bacterium]
MFGNLSYLFLVIIIAVPIIGIEWIFFYNLLRKNIFPIFVNVILGLFMVQISEPTGIFMKAWQYGMNTTLPTLPLGVKLESYIYVITGAISVSSLVIIYSTYQNDGIKSLRNIFLQLFKDLISARYAFWKTGI